MQYRWLNDLSKEFLEKDYLLPNQTLDERVTIICNTAQKYLDKNEKEKCRIDNFSQQFKENLAKGWYSLSTPIWANFGTSRALPCSCYGSMIEDSMESIIDCISEVTMQTKLGGGTSAYFGKLRERGAKIKDNGESSGAVHFMQWMDTLINLTSQGKLRRGNFAASYPLDGKDIEEFLSIRSESSEIQDISFGVCVSDIWMQSMIDGDKYKRKIWSKVIESRINTGYPYIFFTDNVNNNTVDIYKDNKMKIYHSNLCQEICQPNSQDESFVCCLSSMNILYYDEWKNTNAVELLTYFLDAVMQEFIERTKNRKYMERCHLYAKRHRALGIGWLGYHSYLQSKNIPFESMESKLLNCEIAQNIKEKAYEASRKLSQEYGETPLTKGYNRRNTVLLAIAPTKSSSFILGQVSEGIEPIRSNYEIKDLQKGKFTIKNPFLEKILIKKEFNTDEIWESILKNKGSVQHLSCLSNQEKSVFKTFKEISPMEIIIQASQRQKYIDQSQSLNLCFSINDSIKDINKVLIEGWKLGIKTYYYQISESSSQELARNILSCVSCES